MIELMKLIECPGIAPYEQFCVIETLLSVNPLPSPDHTTPANFAASLWFQVKQSCLSNPSNALKIRRLLQGRTDFLAALATNLEEAIQEADTTAVFLQRLAVVPAHDQRYVDLALAPTALENCVLLRGDSLQLYRERHKKWKTQIEAATVELIKSSRIGQWFAFFQWIENDTSITLPAEDRDYVLDTLRSVARRSLRSRCPPGKDIMYLVVQVRDFVDSPPETRDATCITLWLVNNDFTGDVDDEGVWPFFHSAEQFRNSILEAVSRKDAEAVLAQGDNDKRFSNKNLWLLKWMQDSPSPRRKSRLQNSSPSPKQKSSPVEKTTNASAKAQEAVQAPATSLLKAVSEKQRPTCPVCNNTGILSKCDECDE
ncbi:MAG: hypothetical protein Q7T55_16855, partial [Solirubrobacteraceae bacterium]|nr:hypothetical protein [Solirubrobacteraceae bacterium]